MKSIPYCWTHNVVYLPQKHHSRNSYKKLLHKSEDTSSVKPHPQRLHISFPHEQSKVYFDPIIFKSSIWCYSFESNLLAATPPKTGTESQLSPGLLPVSSVSQLCLSRMLNSFNLLLIHPGMEMMLSTAFLPWLHKVCYNPWILQSLQNHYFPG